METRGDRETIMNFSGSGYIRHKDIKILRDEEITALFDHCSANKLEPDLKYLHDKRGIGFYTMTIKKRQI